jgi:hypothetical protein
MSRRDSGAIDTTGMSMKELADVGAPYLVSPKELEALGVEPDLYFKSGSTKGCGWAGWMLDRKKDSELIERLQSMTGQHRTVQ